MDLAAVIGYLREEHRLICDAIAKLEALAGLQPATADPLAPARRKGRPPGTRVKQTPRNSAPAEDA
jgi:hypothetical protein